MNSIVVGDVVRIKDWDDMVEEFGLIDDDIIDTPGIRFRSRFKSMCGLEFEVTNAYVGMASRVLRFEGAKRGFDPTIHMVTLVKSVDDVVVDTSEIDAFLGNIIKI